MQRQRWYAWPSPPKSKRYVPEIFRDRKIPFNHSGKPPAPPPERGFWAPRPGGEWRRGPRGLRYIPARKLPEGYMDPRKKLAFDKIAVPNGRRECQRQRAILAAAHLGAAAAAQAGPADARAAARAAASKAVTAAAAATERSWPWRRPADAGLPACAPPQWQPDGRRPLRPAAAARLDAASRQPDGGRGAPPRPQVQVQHRPRIWAGGVRNESAAPAAVPPHYGRPMVKEAPAKEEKEGLCAIM